MLRGRWHQMGGASVFFWFGVFQRLISYARRQHQIINKFDKILCLPTQGPMSRQLGNEAFARASGVGLPDSVRIFQFQEALRSIVMQNHHSSFGGCSNCGYIFCKYPEYPDISGWFFIHQSILSSFSIFFCIKRCVWFIQFIFRFNHFCTASSHNFLMNSPRLAARGAKKFHGDISNGMFLFFFLNIHAHVSEMEISHPLFPRPSIDLFWCEWPE